VKVGSGSGFRAVGSLPGEGFDFFGWLRSVRGYHPGVTAQQAQCSRPVERGF
jgi:hypothetical protein